MKRWLASAALAGVAWIGLGHGEEAQARHFRRGGTSVFVDIDVGAYGFYRRPLGYYSPAFGHGWRRGYWRHDWYGGRYGWWWVVGPSWYYYPEPIYPFPGYVHERVVERVERADAFDGSVALEDGPGAPPQQFYYYCDEADAYYPYVETCPGGWREVPAVPGDLDEPQ